MGGGGGGVLYGVLYQRVEKISDSEKYNKKTTMPKFICVLFGRNWPLKKNNKKK